MSLTNIFKICLIFFLRILQELEAEIVKLSDENFATEITKYDVALVIFHAPWCGQCKKLMIKLPEIDSELEEFSKNITIVTVNCEKEGKETCDQNHIGGFPILKSFLKGREYGKFEGHRGVDEIVEFMRIESSPVAKLMQDFRNLEKTLKLDDKVTVVGKLHENSKLKAIFMMLAEKLRRKITFLYSHSENSHEWIKVYRQPKLWNKFEEHFLEYDGDEDAYLIENFISKNYHGLVGIRSFSNKNEFNVPLVTAYFNIDYKKNPKLTNYWRNRVLKVATSFKEKFNFAISSRKEFNNELRDMGVKLATEEKPLVVVVLETNEKFILTDNFSVETLKTFLEKIERRSLNPYLKSQKPPDKNESYVVQAVGSTFYEIVMRNTNDTMVKIFAEWCGHCKKLRPIYRKLAKLMRNEKITFVEIDGTENDVPVAYTPTGYPTVYWSTKDYRMSPILYQGDRTLDDFIKFIAKHASSELNAYDRNGNSKRVKSEL